ncbi:pheromone processing endoprotease [Dinochytrium kinnereticum]|nr:pheromone processing endoprotease [Dinochytrium kinnereticum]
MQYDHENRLYFAVQITKDIHPTEETKDPVHHVLHRRAEVAAQDVDMEFMSRVGELSDYFQFTIPRSRVSSATGDESGAELDKAAVEAMIFEKLQSHPHIVWAEQQIPKKRLFKREPPTVDHPHPAAEELRHKSLSKRDVDIDKIATSLGIADPLFTKQWHLFNREPSEVGNDINITGIWEQGIFGENVTVCFVDDGIDYEHEDLKENFFAAGSYDYNDHVALPKPMLPEDRHGTRCAGEVAAKRNDVCGVGIAFKARVAGVRILSGLLTEVDEAAAINFNMQENHIYSCSWGPPDDGRSMDAPPKIVKDAVLNGINNGRGGLGSVFIFAAGNGGAHSDNCNFDGYTNSIYTITVAAIDRKNQHPIYSEECSANMVSMYSSGSGYSIVTTDWGAGPCTEGHGGTSAAAPIVSGIMALVLSIRPDLTWRDIQKLAVQTAIPINLEDSSWEKTSTGRNYSHRFGFGKVDAYAIVEAAKTWKLVNAQVSYKTEVAVVDKPIPQGEGDVRAVLKVAPHDVADFLRLEHITVTVNINHTRRGDVNVKLISPANVVSYLGVKRPADSDTNGFKNWTFMTVKHWDESPVGDWQIVVHDDDNPSDVGIFNYAWLTLWGESKTKPFPNPKHTTTSLPWTSKIPSAHTTLPTSSPGLPSKHPIESIVGSPADSTNSLHGIDQWIFLSVIALVTTLAAIIFFLRRNGFLSSTTLDRIRQFTGLGRGGYKFEELNPEDAGSDDENSMALKSFA